MRTTFLLLIVAGCGLTNPDDEVTITQGIYGATHTGCDTSPCSVGAAENMVVTATSTQDQTAVSTTSDGDGFYQLAVAPGPYSLCVTFHEGGQTCTTVTALMGRLRADWESGPGGGLWCTEGRCAAP